MPFSKEINHFLMDVVGMFLSILKIR